MDDLGREFAAACSRFDESNFDRLDEVDQVLVTIWALEADVNNGGFDQFYFNSSGDLAYFAPTSLEAIGALQMAQIVADANSRFGPDGPPRSRTERQSRLFLIAPPDSDHDPWEALDRAFVGYPDDITALLRSYLRSHGRLADH